MCEAGRFEPRVNRTKAMNEYSRRYILLTLQSIGLLPLEPPPSLRATCMLSRPAQTLS